MADLERRSGEPGYWDDQETAQAEMRRLGELKSRIDTWDGITTSTEDLAVLIEMAQSEPELLDEIEMELTAIREKLDTLELDSALNGPH
ncbi:MAG TPA: PCRF domain-containing protein, partial [Thermomicrobiales bacterium]|nr:PCRF domain-containing protein [Thermomicrobiales bacterium]